MHFSSMILLFSYQDTTSTISNRILIVFYSNASTAPQPPSGELVDLPTTFSYIVRHFFDKKFREFSPVLA